MATKKDIGSEEILRPDWLVDPADEKGGGYGRHDGISDRPEAVRAEADRTGDSHKKNGRKGAGREKAFHAGPSAKAGRTGSSAKAGNKKNRHAGNSNAESSVLLSLRRILTVLKYTVLYVKDKAIRGSRYLYGRLSGHNDVYGRAAGSEQSNRAKQSDNPGQSHSYGQTWEKKAEEEARIRTRKLSAKSLDRREQQLRRHYVFLGILILLLILGIRGIVYRVNTAKREQRMEQELEAEREGLSAAVLGYEDTVKSYAKANGLTEYVDILMAIMEVESKGLGNDVMQSSESMGLAAGSLEPEESISQACVYWGRLLKIADSNDCDIRSVIQAYNFGPGYLTYVAENNGGKYSEDTAIEFARQQSGGETVTYTNEIAVQKNGGWMYSYGNMFYEELVEQYLPEGWDAEYD